MRPDYSNLWNLLFWPCVGLGLLLLSLAVAFVKVRSLLRENEDPTESAHELLAQYRELQGRGELSDEEFRFIKGRLAARIENAPAPPPADGTTKAKADEEFSTAVAEHESEENGGSKFNETRDRI